MSDYFSLLPRWPLAGATPKTHKISEKNGDLKWVDTIAAVALVRPYVKDVKTSISLGFAGEGC